MILLCHLPVTIACCIIFLPCLIFLELRILSVLPIAAFISFSVYFHIIAQSMKCCIWLCKIISHPHVFNPFRKKNVHVFWLLALTLVIVVVKCFKKQIFVLAFHDANCLFFPFTVKCIVCYSLLQSWNLLWNYPVPGISLQCKLMLCGSSELTFTPCTQTSSKQAWTSTRNSVMVLPVMYSALDTCIISTCVPILLSSDFSRVCLTPFMSVIGRSKGQIARGRLDGETSLALWWAPTTSALIGISNGSLQTDVKEIKLLWNSILGDILCHPPHSSLHWALIV